MDNIERIKNDAFRSSKIKYLSLNAKKTLNYFSFAYSNSLKEICIEENVESFGQYTFGAIRDVDKWHNN